MSSHRWTGRAEWISWPYLCSFGEAPSFKLLKSAVSDRRDIVNLSPRPLSFSPLKSRTSATQTFSVSPHTLLKHVTRSSCWVYENVLNNQNYFGKGSNNFNFFSLSRLVLVWCQTSSRPDFRLKCSESAKPPNGLRTLFWDTNSTFKQTYVHVPLKLLETPKPKHLFHW